MSDLVIRAENLSKRYLVGHQAQKRESYTSLRDVIARGAYRFAGKTADFFAGRQIVEGDELEEFWALKDVNFEVRRGEVLGIIGRNGAGKSTLLKVLSRITEPSAGRVTIKGRIASLLEVGTGFHPELTGRENIYLNGAILGMTRAEIRKKFDEIVAFAEADQFLDTPVKRYSSGMYVRLAFAVAAHLEPEILVIDEVLAVGDAEFQKRCLGKMSDVASHGRSVLFVSHNLNAVERLCESVIYLDCGRIKGSYGDVRTGIAEYLKGAGADAGGRAWRPSKHECQNAYFLPRKLEVSSLDKGSSLNGPLSNAHGVKILVEGTVLQPDPALNVGIALYDEREELIFWSFTSDSCEAHWPSLESGLLRLSVVIPHRFLNEGDYRLELLASLHNRAWLLSPRTNSPSVTFSIRGGLSDSPYWDKKRPGVLAPVLAWRRLAANSLPADDDISGRDQDVY